MAVYNLTSSDPSTFILNGIPGLEAAHIWISIPFSTFYIISLLGNFVFLFAVSKEQPLHKPMFLLLCMLALRDIGISTCIVLKALCIFWFRSKDITVNGCLTQMFFIHVIASIHSEPLVLKRLPFCANHIISPTYCEHIAVVKLLCGDTRVYETYSLVIIFVIIGLDLTLIGLSYGTIINAILSISSKKADQKALNTCTAHICVMLMSYTPSLFSALIHRFGQGIAAHDHALLANVYVLVHPMLNPIIYGVKTKELCVKVGKYICRILVPRPSHGCFQPHPLQSVNIIRNGIPGLEAAHIWISVPFSTFYIISLLGNFTVLFFVGREQTLHKPMFLLLCMLALTDIGMSSCVVPKALCIFWFYSKDITVNGCLTQMFFLNAVAAMHSAILVIMAFDRYVAICHPLRYATILINARITKLGLVGFIRAVLLVLPEPLLLRRLPFCANRVILHTYCEHIAMVKMSCGDTRINRTYSLVISLMIIVLDLTLIGLSSVLIIRSILKISSKEAHRKALNTCTVHICVIMMSYTPKLFSTLTHRFGQGIAAHVHILLANLYVLVPPMLNPIIYGVKTKELHDKVVKYTCRM
ncbi:olfactory receptor 52N2-like [Emydura macquarii macquarii]|uniref:olfactory receptor 52N2-like n=1 Tax=Emydura macquarii macquarii TaxID=1129001 RepID=UPI00352A1810